METSMVVAAGVDASAAAGDVEAKVDGVEATLAKVAPTAAVAMPGIGQIQDEVGKQMVLHKADAVEDSGEDIDPSIGVEDIDTVDPY